MIRTIALIAAITAAVLAAPRVLAQDAAAASPRFFIERIEVRNTNRVSPAVIVAESRLREGAEYSEGELRDAAARLTRLPFLLNADFALEKGTERGRHVLVITVTETRSFFFRLDVVPIFEQGPNTRVGFGSQIGSEETGASLGYRWFLGRRGALHVALVGRESTELTRGYGAFAVGWTQYDLFGTRAFATVNIKDSPQLGTSPQLVVGIPLSLNQTLTAEYDELVVDEEVSYAINDAFNDRDVQRLARLTWSYNTTNHPFVPTEGTLFSAGPLAAWRDETSIFGVVGGPDPRFDVVPIHSRVLGFEASALRYWEVSDRNSVSLGVEGRAGRVDQRWTFENVRRNASLNTYTGVAQLGASRSLWSPERRAQGGDSRIEFFVRSRLRNDEYDDGRLYRRDVDTIQTSLAWVRHSSWGTLRLGVGAAW